MKMVPIFHYLPTGEILCSGDCPEDEVKIQQPLPGAKVGVGPADFRTNYYDTLTNRIEPLPVKPGDGYQFDWFDKRWKPDYPHAWVLVREARDQLLQECDWTQLPDVPIGIKDAWAEYRQALRDITQQDSPFSIVWPNKPQ